MESLVYVVGPIEVADQHSMFKSIKDELELNLDKDRLILGDPEECLPEFQRQQEATGAETCLLRLRHAHSVGSSHGQIMKTIDSTGDRIIPYCN